jgi:hypothetical protein
VDLGYVFYDRQPQTGASELTTAPLVDPIKTLKESGQMLAIDSRTGVRNSKLSELASLTNLNPYLALSFCVLNGVIDKIDERLLHET